MAYHLLDSQMNEVYGLITAAGLDPADFEWEVDVGPFEFDEGPVIRHRPTGFYFKFGLNQTGSHLGEWSPARQRSVDDANLGGWATVRAAVGEWLRFLKREWTQPDLWGALERDRELLAAGVGEEAENTAFTDDERGQIAAQLREVRELLVRSQQLDEEHQQALDGRLRYLEGASGRLGRVDWINVAVSTLAGYVAQFGLPPTTLQEAFSLLWAGLGGLFGGGFPELPPG